MTKKATIPGSTIGPDRFAATGMPLFVLPVYRRDGEELCHEHDCIELVVVVSGTATHFTRVESYTVAAGDVFVLHPRQLHGYSEMHEFRLFNFLFDFDKLGIPLFDLEKQPGFHALFTLEPAFRRQHRFEGRLRLPLNQTETIRNLGRQMWDEFCAKPDGYQFAAVTLFMRVLGLLTRAYVDASQPKAETMLRIGRAVSYLHQHYADPIRVEDLCAMANMSERTLARAFRKAYDKTPIEYLLRLRIDKGAELLMHTDDTVGEIAEAVGFQDANYFSRQFRRFLRISPTAYRNSGMLQDGWEEGSRICATVRHAEMRRYAKQSQ